MTKLYVYLIAFLLTVTSQISNSGLISGLNEYDGGIVNLSGLDWMPVDMADSDQLDRNEIESLFSDSLSEFYGFRYATRIETSTLLNSLGPVEDGWSSNSYAGISWFFDAFGVGPFSNNNSTYWDFFYGSDDECIQDISQSCYANILINHEIMKGHMFNFAGYDPLHPTPNIRLKSDDWWRSPTANASHLLVKSSAVPEPPSIILIIVGILVLTYRRSVRNRYF